MNRKSIIFFTSNTRKVGEAKEAAKLFNVEIEQIAFDVHEIQSTNPKEVSEHKVKSAYQKIKKPVVVTDTFWNIPAYNGFPGAYMKDVTGWFTEQDFIDLMASKKDKRVAFSENISYFDGKKLRQFNKEYWGVFVNPPRGSGNSLENVVEFDGYTLGERREQGGFSHKPENYVWSDFFAWFTKQ